MYCMDNYTVQLQYIVYSDCVYVLRKALFTFLLLCCHQ